MSDTISIKTDDIPIVPVAVTPVAVSTPVAAPVAAPKKACGSCHLDLLTWKDPIKTGKVFGTILVSLIVFKTVNLFNVFFHLAYIGLLISAAVEYAGKLVTGQGFITKYKPSTNTIAKQFNNEVLPLLAEFNLKFENEFQKVVYAHDIETTLKSAGISYILYKITSWFSFFTLLATGVVLAFTVPAVYLKNKKQIDALVAEYSKLAKEKTGEYTKLVQEKAAPVVEDLIKKAGPVGSFISSKFPTRTAGSTVGSSSASTFGTKADDTVSLKSTASASGSSKFPDVGAASLKSSTIEDVIEEVKSAHVDAAL